MVPGEAAPAHQVSLLGRLQGHPVVTKLYVVLQVNGPRFRSGEGRDVLSLALWPTIKSIFVQVICT